ncbi:MAG: transglutaminase domain-containing protein [Planctomycetes bacterium]|nr:transglutaminase domain-containing protein [Planctomycetota bacterium]
MSPARLLAFFLVAVQVVAFGYMTETLLFPKLAMLLALVGLTGRFRVQLRREQELILALLLALPFVFLWRLTPGYRPQPEGFIAAGFTYCLGQYLILLQILPLYLPRERPLPLILPFYGLLVMLSAGNIYVFRVKGPFYQAMALAFTGLAALYFECARTKAEGARRFLAAGRLSAAAATLIAAAAASAAADSWIRAHQREIEIMAVRLLNRVGRESVAGFSKDARLDSVTNLRAGRFFEGTALRVISSARPGYLRGMAYDEYQDGAWQSTAAKMVLSPDTPNPPAPLVPPGHGSLFILEDGASPWASLEVWPTPQVEEGMFLPLETAAVRAPIHSLEVDANGITDSRELVGGVPYSALVPERARRRGLLSGSLDGRPRSLTDDFRGSPQARPYLSLPAKLDPRIVDLAHRVFAGCATPREKMRAVEEYFHQNHEYRLGIQIPEGRDPVTYFLLERLPGHCEYFASAAALLLRIGGVPSRYVAGFLCHRWNVFGRYWVAEHRDAHAWVEAYDENSGWRRVEATPPPGQPESSGMGRMAQFWDYLKHRVQELFSAIRSRGWRGAASWLLDRLKGLVNLMRPAWPVGLPLLLALAAYGVLRRWKKKRGSGITRPGQPPEVLALQELLRQMDHRLRKEGLIRPEHQTLEQFASVIESVSHQAVDTGRISRWYRDYSRVRYGGNMTPEGVARLKQEARLFAK